MVCIGNCMGLGDSEIENMVWGLDNFYVVILDDVEIGKGEELLILEVRLKFVVIIYIFLIKIEGLKNVLLIIGSVFGMVECYYLGKGVGLCCFVFIYCEIGKGNGVIKGSFICFGYFELM